MTLKEYLDGLGDKPAVVAAEFGALLGVSRHCVERWRDGRVPRAEHIKKIFEKTGGKVDPASFYSVRKPRKAS